MTVIKFLQQVIYNVKNDDAEERNNSWVDLHELTSNYRLKQFDSTTLECLESACRLMDKHKFDDSEVPILNALQRIRALRPAEHDALNKAFLLIAERTKKNINLEKAKGKQ